MILFSIGTFLCEVLIFNELQFKPLQLAQKYLLQIHFLMRMAVAQWLRCCVTNWKVACPIPLEFFIDIKSFRSHYGPGVDSASNRNEYQEYFLGVKAAGA